MSSKRRRQTFEKLKREQAVKEKRALKQQKREAARLAKGMDVPADGEPTPEGDGPPAAAEE